MCNKWSNIAKMCFCASNSSHTLIDIKQKLLHHIIDVNIYCFYKEICLHFHQVLNYYSTKNFIVFDDLL